MRYVRLAAIVVSTTSVIGIARADVAAGAKLEQEAEAFVASGDFLNAAAKYRLAFAEDPRPELVCNVGVAYVKANDPVRAHVYLSRCLERGASTLEASFTETVRTVMNTVEQTLRTGDFTPVDITVVPQGATVAISGFGKDETFVGSRVVWLPFGKHAISAELDGYATGTVDVDLHTHTTTAASITLVKAPPKIVEEGPRPTRVVVDPPASKLPAVVATAVSVGALVFAGLAFNYAHDRADLSGFALTVEAFNADREAVDGWNKVFAMSTAIGIAGAGVSAFLWYRALHTSSHVEVMPAPSGATLTFATRW